MVRVNVTLSGTSDWPCIRYMFTCVLSGLTALHCIRGSCNLYKVMSIMYASAMGSRNTEGHHRQETLHAARLTG